MRNPKTPYVQGAGLMKRCGEAMHFENMPVTQLLLMAIFQKQVKSIAVEAVQKTRVANVQNGPRNPKR